MDAALARAAQFDRERDALLRRSPGYCRAPCPRVYLSHLSGHRARRRRGVRMRARAGAAAAPAAGERLFPALAVLLRDVRAGKIPGYTGAGAWPHGPAAYGPGTGILQILCGAFLPAGESQPVPVRQRGAWENTSCPLHRAIPCCKRAATWCMSARRARLTPSNASAIASGEGDTHGRAAKPRSCLFWTTSARSIFRPICKQLPVQPCQYPRVPPPAHHLHQQHRATTPTCSAVIPKRWFPACWAAAKHCAFCGTDIRLMDK